MATDIALTPSSLTAEPVLSLQHASKAFDGVLALQDVSLDLFAGEAHALVGENGAGKSTLIKILGGVYQPDDGMITLAGEDVVLTGPGDAADRGVSVIFQEPTLFPDLSVAENVFVGRQPLRPGRRIDGRAMEREVSDVFRRLGVAIDPQRIARGLSIAEQQLVEVAKALTRRSRVLIMDEPTAALSPVEAKRLFAVVEALRGEGAAIVFVSHRLEEVFAICQRVTVLRDGRLIVARGLDELSEQDLVRAMVGRDVKQGTHEHHHPGATMLEVEHLTREGVFVDINFQVRAGEVVALAGLVGSGRSEVARAIFGVDRYDAGTVTINGKQLTRGSPAAAMRVGLGLVPEDRRQQGLVMEMSVPRNIALASMARLRNALHLIPGGRERRFGAEWAQRLQVKYGRASAPVSLLSGGNQQKVVLAKWLARSPTVLIVDEPTRGIDIGTKTDVHDLIASLARDGVAVLVISSELPEVLTLADRVLVMREGRLVSALERKDATEEAIVAAGTAQSPAATGVKSL